MCYYMRVTMRISSDVVFVFGECEAFEAELPLRLVFPFNSIALGHIVQQGYHRLYPVPTLDRVQKVETRAIRM